RNSWADGAEGSARVCRKWTPQRRASDHTVIGRGAGAPAVAAASSLCPRNRPKEGRGCKPLLPSARASPTMTSSAATLEYQPKRRREKRKTHFWRATAYLRPYRKLVVASVLFALLAGGVLAGSITAVLPVLQTLLNGDTPQMWVDRIIAERRLDIDIADDPDEIRVLE